MQGKIENERWNGAYVLRGRVAGWMIGLPWRRKRFCCWAKAWVPWIGKNNSVPVRGKTVSVDEAGANPRKNIKLATVPHGFFSFGPRFIWLDFGPKDSTGD